MSGDPTRGVSAACVAGVTGYPRSEPVCSHCGAAGVEPCTGRPAATDLHDLVRAVEELAENYRVRARYAPEPPAQWAAIEADLRRILAAAGRGGDRS